MSDQQFILHILYGTKTIDPVIFTITRKVKVFRRWGFLRTVIQELWFIETVYSRCGPFASYKDVIETLMASGVKYSEIVLDKSTQINEYINK